MRPRTRSISGAALMLVIIPIFAGLLACMPVPIGDPERSRIEPEMNGWWVMEDGGGDVSLFVVRPYDKRTALVFWLGVTEGDEAEIDDAKIDTASDLLTLLEKNEVGSEGIVGVPPLIYKSWLTRLGGVRFLTWEPVAQIENVETFVPDAWFVLKVASQTPDSFELLLINYEYDAFDDIIDELDEDEKDPWKARKHWERVIKKNVDDPDLYSESKLVFTRLPDELAPKAAKLLAWPFDY